MEPHDAAPPRRRLVRAIAWTLLALAALVAGSALAGLFALHHLDAPWIKQRVLAQVTASTGLQVDYRHASVSLRSGATLQGVVVRTPGPLQAAAPALLRVASLDARWTLASLAGSGTKLTRVRLRGVSLTLASDAQGHTSLGALSGATATPAPRAAATAPEEVPAAPGLSAQVAALLAGAPPVARLELDDVSVRFVQVQGDAGVERLTLRGLAATAETYPLDGGFSVRVALGQPGAPLHLEVAREGEAPARAQLTLLLSAALRAGGGRAAVKLGVDAQTFAPGVEVAKLAQATATVAFDAVGRRAVVTVPDAELADGAATLQARLALPDAPGATPVLTQASADVDLARALRGLPAAWVPLALDGGQAHLRAHDLPLGGPGAHAGAGALTLDADLAGLRLRGSPAALASAHVSIAASADPGGGLRADTSFDLKGIEVGGPAKIQAAQLGGTLEGHRLGFDPTSPLRLAGDLELAASVPSAALEAGSAHVGVRGLEVHVHAPLGKPPLALKVTLGASELQVIAAGRTLVQSPAQATLDASQIALDLADLPRTRARAALTLDVAGVHTAAHATKGADDAAFEVAVRAPSLAAVRALLPPQVAARAKWARMALTLHDTGTVAALSSVAPEVATHTELHIERPTWDALSAGAVTLAVDARGGARKQRVRADVKIAGLRLGAADAGPQHLSLWLTADRSRPAVKLRLQSLAGPPVSLDAALSYARRAVRCDLTAHLGALGPLVPVLQAAQVPLPPLDLSRLGIDLAVHGDVVGLVEGFDARGAPRLAPAPRQTAAFRGTAALDASKVHWRQPELTLDAPSVSWRAALDAKGGQRTLQSHLALDKLWLRAGERALAVAGLRDDTTATLSGDPARGDVTVTESLSVHDLRGALPAYPVRDLTLRYAAHRKPSGVIHIGHLALSNPGAQTTLALRGVLDLSDVRRHLGLRGTLTQDLSKLGAAPEVFDGRGSVSMAFRVASPDLSVFRTRVDLRASGVTVHLPQAHISVEGLDGRIPINENVEVRGGAVRLLHDNTINLYSMLRFPDQHPLIQRSGFISVAHLTTPYAEVSPLAGNLAIDQNVFAMSQFELGLRGGKVTGQCVLDWRGRRSTLQAHVRATGVRSSHGEPFDGNAAVVISARDRSVDGRAEILKIGNRHLLDLLDLEDPHHTDPSINRVRHALSLGYPDHVRVVFDHGFASARIALGGLARLLSIDDIRGVPMGPLVDRALGAVFPSPKQEKP